MTLTLSITNAAMTLSQVLERAQQGEEIIVTEDGKPVARFILLEKNIPPLHRISGTAKGQIVIEEDFDVPLPDSILESFEA